MKKSDLMDELILDDELINDFEFAERLYKVSLSHEFNDGYFEGNLFWDTFV